MKRRTVLGLAAWTTASLVTAGSGAFTVARVDREMTVDVVDDSEAYLALRELGSGGRSVEDGRPGQTVRFSFPGDDEERVSGHPVGDGLGTDSVYEFVSDADGAVDGLLEIVNKETNTVEVSDDQDETDGPRVELFDVTDSDRRAIRENHPVLSPGESVRVGVRIDTHGVEIGGGDSADGSEYWETISLLADETA